MWEGGCCLGEFACGEEGVEGGRGEEGEGGLGWEEEGGCVIGGEVEDGHGAVKVCENERGRGWRGLGVFGVAVKGSWRGWRVGKGEEEEVGG